MPVVGWELGCTLEPMGSKLKSAKYLWCDLDPSQAKCLNAQLRSLKLYLQCVGALVSQPSWACVIHSEAAQSSFT